MLKAVELDISIMSQESEATEMPLSVDRVVSHITAELLGYPLRIVAGLRK